MHLLLIGVLASVSSTANFMWCTYMVAMNNRRALNIVLASAGISYQQLTVVKQVCGFLISLR